MKKLASLLLLVVASFNPAFSAGEPFFPYQMKLPKETQTLLNLPMLWKAPKQRKVRIAILDQGFKGIDPKSVSDEGEQFILPPNVTTVFSHKNLKDGSSLEKGDPHGTQMYLAVRKTTGDDDINFEYRLYNAGGRENFVASVDDLIEWKADIAVHSINWERFGNFDGTGRIDEAINEAVLEGVIWVNAAGNYGGNVYNSRVQFRKNAVDHGDGKSLYPMWLWQSKDWADTIRFTNSEDENEVTITLSWNSNDPKGVTKGTKKDLALYLYKDIGGDKIKRVASADKVQVESNPDPKKNETLDASERLVVRLKGLKDKEYYHIGVSSKNPENFGETDTVRITITSNKPFKRDQKSGEVVRNLTLIDATQDGETMVGADAKGLAIGNFGAFSSKGPTANGRAKPDIIFTVDSVGYTNTSLEFFGTSYSNAIMGGVAALLKGIEPGLTQKNLLSFRSNDTTRYWISQGWEFDKDKVTQKLSKKLCDELAKEFGLPNCAVKESDDGMIAVGTFRKPKTRFSSYVEGSLERFFLYNAWVTKYRIEKDPDQTITEPGTTKTIPGKIEWKTETQPAKAQLVVINGYLYIQFYPAVTYNTPVKAPDTKEYIPGPTKTIKGQEHKIPYRELDLKEWTSSGTKRVPWEEIPGDPKDFVEVVFFKVPKITVNGKVLDGSEDDPRIWQGPISLEELKKVVRGE